MISTTNRSFPGWVFFLSLYIALATVFFMIHFSQMENFTFKTEEISLKGRSSIGTPLVPAKITRIQVEANGIIFSLNRLKKATLVTEDDIHHSLDITSWEGSENSVFIEFTQGSGLTIKKSKSGGISVIPLIPSTVPPVKAFLISLDAAKRTDLSTDKESSDILKSVSSETTFIVNLPENSSWNKKTKELTLSVSENTSPILEIADESVVSLISASEWLALGKTPSANSFNQIVERWLRSSLQKWEARLAPSSASTQWSNDLAAALLSAAIPRKTLSSSIQNLTTAAARFPGQINWLPSPYLGNIVNQSQSHRRYFRSLASGIQSKTVFDTADFRTNMILDYLIDAGYPSVARRMMNQASKITNNLSGKDIVGRMNILREASRLSLGSQNILLNQSLKIAKDNLLPRIIWSNEKLHLMAEENIIFPEECVAAGRLLIDIGTKSNRTDYLMIGRQLIISALSNADENENLPSRIQLRNRGREYGEGKLSSEAIYPWIVNSQNYPRHTSLYRELGVGAWVLSGAKTISVISTEAALVLRVTSVAGTTHHMAIEGIKPFASFFMNGREWSSDPNFQKYVEGWVYDEGNETLFMKLQHNTAVKTIRLVYPVPEEPVVEESEEELSNSGADDSADPNLSSNQTQSTGDSP